MAVLLSATYLSDPFNKETNNHLGYPLLLVFADLSGDGSNFLINDLWLFLI